MKIALFSDETDQAVHAAQELQARYDFVAPDDADVGVALGGDGYILSILHQNTQRQLPIYGMNRGTVGFMLNGYSTENLEARLHAAIPLSLHPLRLNATRTNGEQKTLYAINEVSFIRQSQQAAHIDILIDDVCHMEKMFADGVCIATPAGSTAYNFA
ncbi:MAG: NAD(+)/NADH kinase, partial [Pseudomonadota bacterium]